MNKTIGYYLYNIIFWVSRFITLFIFGICLTAVLNAKYIFWEVFFSKILWASFCISFYTSYYIQKYLNITHTFNVLQFSLFTDPIATKSKYYFYKLFCINSQSIDILICLFLFILVIYFFIKYMFKLTNKKLIVSTVIVIFLIYSLTYFFTGNLNFLLLSLIIPIIFIILYIINLLLPSKLQDKIMVFPVIGELFCINNVLLFVTKKKQKEFFILIISIIVSNMIFIFMPYYTNTTSNDLLEKGSIYNITFDNKKDRFIISSKPILLFENNNKTSHKMEVSTNLYQDILVNWEKEEMYIYNIENGVLYIFDINTLKEKAKVKILNYDDIKNNTVFTRLAYNDKKDIILIVFESTYGAFLVDLNKLHIVQQYDDIISANDSIIYNKFRNSFALTSYQGEENMQEININSNSTNNVVVGSEQGYIAISNKNKEIYIAFHQQGRIGVYDAETMELKRKIKSSYAIKNITYDEDLNVLISPSYLTGYVDIFLMDGSDKLLKRQFVGYELREAKFDAKKENLYVCSKNGLYKVPINIRELIENVSHETNN